MTVNGMILMLNGRSYSCFWGKIVHLVFWNTHRHSTGIVAVTSQIYRKKTANDRAS